MKFSFFKLFLIAFIAMYRSVAIAAPEIEIKGRNVTIVSGDINPATEDNTSFNRQFVAGGTTTQSFTIHNSGNTDLVLSGNPIISGTNSGDFSLTLNPSLTIPSGGFTTFSITFDPSATGNRTATLTINNNDTNEGTYTFSILGVGQSNTQVRWVNNVGATRPTTVSVNGVSYNVIPTTYTTIQSAINAAVSDDIVYITDGLYRNPNEATSNSCIFSGTGQEFNLYLTIENKGITLTSETGNHCTSNARLVGYGIFFDNASNTTVQGLHLDSVRVNGFWDTNFATGSPYSQSGNIRILNNKVTNTRGHGIKTDTGGPTGVPINRGAWDIIGNYFENIGFYNAMGDCPSPAPVTAMWLGEAGNSFVISNNAINNTKWAGILCDGYGGYVSMSPVYTIDGAVTISGNRINNTVDAAIQIGFSSGTPGFYPLNAYINHNTITNANTSNSVSAAAICVLSSNIKGKNITNNDISSSFNGLSICIAGWESANPSNFTFVNNNNFYSLSGGYGVTHIAGISPNGTWGTADDLTFYSFENNYWGAGNGPTYPTNPSGSGVPLRKDTNPLGGGTYSLGEYDFSPFSSTFNSVSSVSLACCQAPSASISYPLATYCVSSSPVSVNRTGTAGGTYSASPAGLALNGDTGEITPGSSAVGSYTVTYIIGSGTGCSLLTTTTTVNIVNSPSATISYANATYCNNASAASVTRTGTSGGTYSASPAGLSIDFNTGQITPNSSAANSYTVTYTIAATGSCALYTTTTTVNIIATPPNPNLVASNNNPCAGTQITLTATPSVGYTASEFLWYRNGVAINWGYSNTYTVNAGSTAASNNYSVQIVYTGYPCFSSNAANTTVVTSVPNATITPSGAITFCANNPTTLNATSGMTNYVWRRGSTVVGTNSNSYTPTQSCNHNLTVTNANACSKTSPWINITINPLPTANAGTDKNLCEGSSVQIGGVNNVANTYTWSPTQGLNNPYISNPTTTTANTTTYTLTVNNSSTGCSNTDAVLVTLLPVPPTPSISNGAVVGSLITLTANSPSASSINWYRNGAGYLFNKAPNSTISVYVSMPTNAYTIRSKGANGCLSFPSNTLNLRKGDEMLIAENAMQVYPNPSTDLLNVVILQEGIDAGKISLINSLGQVVFEQNITLLAGKAAFEIDMKPLAAGVYSLSFQSETLQSIQKVVKE